MAKGHSHDHGRTFTLHAVEVTDEFLDLGDPGLSPGDQPVFATALSRDGRPEGVTGGSCTVTSLNSDNTFTASCHATAQLRGGLLTTQAVVTFGPSLQPPSAARPVIPRGPPRKGPACRAFVVRRVVQALARTRSWAAYAK
jgi:hypothetical protein